MEIKKKPSVNLEKDRFTFILAGFVMALGIVYGAMEWTSATGIVTPLTMDIETEFETDLFEHVRHQPEQPKLPKPKPIAEIIEIIEDDSDIEETMEIESMEIDENDLVEIIEFDDEDEDLPQEPFVTVQYMPEYPGGVKALMKFLAKTVKYPNLARENGVQGRVFVRFVVTEKGTVERVSVVRGVDPQLDKEAMRVVSLMDGWKPGRQRDKPVPVWYTVPINFVLN